MLAGSLLLGLILGFAIFLPSQLSKRSAGTSAQGKNETITNVGSLAPDFSLTDALSGTQYKLSDLRGKPIVLNFWATWCAPCREEMPTLQAAALNNALDHLLVLGVNAGESKNEISEFAHAVQITFPLLIDPDSAVNDLYRVRAYPTTYFIDKDGKIAAFHLGILTPDLLQQNLDTILP